MMASESYRGTNLVRLNRITQNTWDDAVSEPRAWNLPKPERVLLRELRRAAQHLLGHCWDPGKCLRAWEKPAQNMVIV